MYSIGMFKCLHLIFLLEKDGEVIERLRNAAAFCVNLAFFQHIATRYSQLDIREKENIYKSKKVFKIICYICRIKCFIFKRWLKTNLEGINSSHKSFCR